DELHMPVYIGMRNWRPYIGDTVRQMAADGVTEAVAICLAPHNSRTSVGLYRRAVVGETGNAPFTLTFVESWHDHPPLIEAFGERLRAGYARATKELGGKLPVILTAHSVPVRTVEAGDPYEKQARHTAELVAACVPEIETWSFAFQSQGMSGGVWLGPTVEDTIAALAKDGHKGVFMQPIGFVCDHIEILYDIDIMFRDVAAKHGMKLWRAESLNDSSLFVRAVAELAREQMNDGQGVRLR
ncbi:MAG TPA: ferrochelatase, partial [Candidatus Acidoferrales bacterium]|nr:ferrochelatase [Candidatus Acidoferrales bacterium]